MSISKSIKLFGSRLFTSLKSIEDSTTYVGYTHVCHIKILIEKKIKIKTESQRQKFERRFGRGGSEEAGELE